MVHLVLLFLAKYVPGTPICLSGSLASTHLSLTDINCCFHSSQSHRSFIIKSNKQFLHACYKGKVKTFDRSLAGATCTFFFIKHKVWPSFSRRRVKTIVFYWNYYKTYYKCKNIWVVVIFSCHIWAFQPLTASTLLLSNKTKLSFIMLGCFQTCFRCIFQSWKTLSASSQSSFS